MTTNTNRNNVKPMFWCITFMVMIVRRLVATRTLQRIGSRQSTNTNCAINSTCSFFIDVIWVSIMKAFCRSPKSRFSFFALAITLYCGFTFFAFPISFSIISLIDFAFLSLSMFLFFGLVFYALFVAFYCSFTLFTLSIIFFTSFARAAMPVFMIFVFAKFRNGFDFFAFGTSFRYDLFSHFRLLTRRFWLEPYARPVRVSGSLYYNTIKKKGK